MHSTPRPSPLSFLRTDSNAPTWSNNLDGHVNLRDALRRTISFTAPNGAPLRAVQHPVSRH